MLGISPRFDVFMQMGMHAMAGTPHACLAHTQSRGYTYRINGREFGEMEQAALLAVGSSVPLVFLSS